MKNRSGIYEILNTVNGKRYIGHARKFSKRWKEHVGRLTKGKHHSRHLQAAWDKYGEAAFKFRIILTCAPTKEMLLFYEQQLIDKAQPEYNIARIAGSTLGTKRTPEFCAAISERMRGHHYGKGYKRTPEQCENISKSQTGKVLSPEHKAAISKGGRGIKKSPETRERMSRAQKGNKKGVGKRPPEFSAKQSIRMLGNKYGVGVKRPRTPEHTARIVASRLANKLARLAAQAPC